LAFGIFFGTSANAQMTSSYNRTPVGEWPPEETFSFSGTVTNQDTCNPETDDLIFFLVAYPTTEVPAEQIVHDCTVQGDNPGCVVLEAPWGSEPWNWNASVPLVEGNWVEDQYLLCGDEAGFSDPFGDDFTVAAGQQPTFEQVLNGVRQAGQTTWDVFLALLPVILTLTVVLLLVNWGIKFIF